MTDVVWNEPGADVSRTQSYGWIVLNAIYDRLSTTSVFSGFTVKRIASALPIEAGYQIPFIGVFRKRDGFNGDFPNMGEIRFKYALNIGIQIVLANNDPVAMQTDLDRASWFIMNQLWRDDTLTNRLKSTLPDNTRLEGVTKIDIVEDRWGLTGSKNETPVGIRVLNIAMDLGIVDFAPTEFPDLERITVITAWPPGDPDAQQKVQQVKIVYEFNPDSVPTPLPPDPPLGFEEP